MRIFFLCANDKVFLPFFFEQIFSRGDYDYKGVAIVADPYFKRFLKNSLSFMGISIFISEVTYQIKLRLINFVKKLVKPSSLKTIENICSKFNINYYHVDKINTKAFRKFLEEREIDVLVSTACPQILKSKILAIPKKAAINIHYAILPHYRGQYPSFWVLANSERYTGATVHHMVQEVDAGEIIVQLREQIKPEDSFYSLVRRLKTVIGPRAMLEALAKIDRGDDSVIENDVKNGSYFSFPGKSDMKKFLNRGRKWR